MSAVTRDFGWSAALRQRIRTQAWLKALGNTVFLIVFFQLYLGIQKHPVFEVTQIPASAVDDWIGFQPWTIGLYLSLWVYTALPVALQLDGRRLFRYSVAMTALCSFGLLVFFFWPTSVSEAVGVRSGGSPLFSMLYAVDNNGNACPSLHVAASVLSGLWLEAILRKTGSPTWLRLVNLLWCLGIVFSTMGTKQHMLLDVLSGTVLGVVVGWISLRRAGTV